jgi:hypothetical protein
MALVFWKARSILRAAFAVASVFIALGSDDQDGVLNRNVRRGHPPERIGQALGRQPYETGCGRLRLLEV